MIAKFKNIYHSIEKFSSERPVLFWLITLLITSIPFLATWKYIKAFLNQEFAFKGYEFLVLILIPFALIGIIKILTPNKFIKNILIELNSMKSALDKPFEVERSGFMNNEKYKEKYYHSEIIEFFSKYNGIVLELRKRNLKKYGDIKTRDEIPKVGSDWVPVTKMHVIKTDIELLINKLN